MDFISLARERYSVRSFRPDPVPNDIVRLILEAGNAAPTACDLQPQIVIAVQSEEGLEKFRRCTECHFNAPLAFIIGYDSSVCWHRSYDGKASGEVDSTIVATHMMLEAADLGIGSTWVMHFIPEAVMTEFCLPSTFMPVALLVMGYPAEDAKPSKLHSARKDLDSTVHFQ